MDSCDDSALIQRLRLREADVVADIDARYGGELRLFCQRMVHDAPLAEDIVQDVLVACCKAEPDCLPAASLRGWLYQVARNRALDEIRKYKLRRPSPVNPAMSRLWADSKAPIDPHTTPAGRANKEDRARRVQLALADMPVELRETIVLYFFQGLSREEVALAVDLTVAGVKARLAKATRLLRDRLASLNDSSS